ncbi:MAG: alpha/beta hydrolase [Nanoarchaeota archaeon]
MTMKISPKVFLSRYKVIHKFAVINGIRTHWVEFGRGKPLVGLHGIGGAWTDYWSLLPVLKNRKCYFFDMPGCGKTDKIDNYKIENLSAWLKACIGHLSLMKFTVEAICSSAPIAIDYASKYPEKVDSLILHMPVINGAWVDPMSKFQAFLGRALPNFLIKFLFNQSWFSKLIVNTDEKETIVESALLDQENKRKADFKGMSELISEVIRSDSTKKLKNFRGKLVVIALQGDKLSPVEKLIEVCPKESVKVFDNAHSWNEEVIIKQNKEIKNFLS